VGQILGLLGKSQKVIDYLRKSQLPLKELSGLWKTEMAFCRLLK
jgi:hypothetical protein